MFKPVPSKAVEESYFYQAYRTSRASSEKDLWIIFAGVLNRLIHGL